MELLGIATLLVVMAYGYQGLIAMGIVVGCYIVVQIYGGDDGI